MMASDLAQPAANASDRELALWMLEKMKDSAEFLRVIQAARRGGAPDVLDEPEYVEHHQGRLKRLYQSDASDEAPMTSVTAATIDALLKRDLLSSREELIEKAIAAYLARHPKGLEGLPSEWATTVEAARAEIEGRTSGAFEPSFTGELAAAAREEIARNNEHAKGRDRDRGRERP